MTNLTEAPTLERVIAILTALNSPSSVFAQTEIIQRFKAAQERYAHPGMDKIAKAKARADMADLMWAQSEEQPKKPWAILEEYRKANRIDSITYMDFTVIFVPDADENGPYCSEILALETNDGVQHFPPYADLQSEFILPEEDEITNELRDRE